MSKYLKFAFVGVFVMGLFGSLFASGPSARAEQAWQEIAAGAVVVDVRTPAEFASGHVKGAINIPLDQVAQGFAKYDKNTNIVVYCRSGNRSGQAQSFLLQNGFTKVHNGGGVSEMLEAEPK